MYMVGSYQQGMLTNAERLARRSRWSDAIAAEDLTEIDAAFRAGGAEPPSVIWNPRPDQIGTGPCRFLHEYWRQQCGGAQVAPAAAIDPIAMRPALGYVLLVDVVDGGVDFRYRVYGSLIASVSAQDMTGRLISDHHASDYVVDFSIACGRAGMRQRLPLCTLRHPARTEYTRAWERLQLPLAGPDGAITRLLIGNVPIDRTGDVLRPRF